MPILGGGDHTSHHTWGMDSCLPEPAGRRTQGQIKRQTELETLRQLHGGRADGQAGRQAVWGRSLWSLANAGAYCRGFSRLTLAPALKLQVGMLRQAWPLPYSSPWATPCLPHPFPELWAGFLWVAAEPHSASLGTSEASARQMGQVRLAWEEQPHIRPYSPLTSHPTYLTWINSTHLTTGNTWEPAQATLPSTTCQHTWHGTHGCRAGLGAAAAPQSH